MQTYKKFVFGREDEHNINLYQHQMKEISEGGGKGKGRGKGTGKFEERLCFVGHYNSVSGVLNKILQMDLEDKEVREYNRTIEDMTKFIDKLKLSLPIEEKKILEQVGED